MVNENILTEDEKTGVTHKNSEKGWMSLLNEDQKNLMDSYENMYMDLYDEATLNAIRQRLLEIAEPCDKAEYKWQAGGHISKSEIKEEAVEEWLKDHEGLDQYLKKGCVIQRINIENDAKIIYESPDGSRREHKNHRANSIFKGVDMKTYDIQKPHSCGGFGRHVGPYHIGCTECDCEVKMWEYGVEYDCDF